MKKKIFKITGKNKNVYGVSYPALWNGILLSLLFWIIAVGSVSLVIAFFTEQTIFSIAILLKFATAIMFFLGGFIAAHKAGFKGWQHGMWVGVFLGMIAAIFILELVPTITIWKNVLLQWITAVIIGTLGGILGFKTFCWRKDKIGYTFKEARKDRFRQLDRSR